MKKFDGWVNLKFVKKIIKLWKGVTQILQLSLAQLIKIRKVQEFICKLLGYTINKHSELWPISTLLYRILHQLGKTKKLKLMSPRALSVYGTVKYYQHHKSDHR